MPAEPRLRLEVKTDKASNTVEAGDSYEITAVVTNDGPTPVCRVAGRTESTLGRTNDKEFVFGRIEPGKSVTRTLNIKTNHAQSSRVDNFDMKLYLDDGTPIPEKSVAAASIDLTTNAQPQPSFAIHYAIIDKDGNSNAVGNGLLDDNEEVTMRIWVSNEGRGTAEKPLIFIKNKGAEIKLLDARTETEALPTGAVLSRDFKFKTTEIGPADGILELHVYDKASTHTLIEKIAFKTSKNEKVEKQKVSAIKDKMRLVQNSPLRVSPLESANSLSELPAETVVQADAVFGEYTHITAGSVMGWIASSALEKTDSPVSALQPEMIATIPRIVLADMPHVTDQASITIDADVTAFAPLRDFYAYTAHDLDHTYTIEKVSYIPLESKTAHIHTDIPLNKGMNSIRLYVRDSNKSEAHDTILVYRK